MKQVQVYCSECWAAIPPTHPRIVMNGQWVCATCAYRIEKEAQDGHSAG